MEKILLILLFIGVLAGYHILFIEPEIQKIEKLPQILSIDEDKLSDRIFKLSVERNWGEKQIEEAINAVKQKISNYDKDIILDSRIILNPEKFDITNKLLEE